MIKVIDIVTRIGQLLEDESGNYYDINDVVIPAINTAIEWLTAIITPHLTSGNYREELFSDSSRILVFQTSKHGRVFIDPEAVKFGIWKIVSVYPKPHITIVSSDTLNFLPYYNRIYSFIGGSYKNTPLIDKFVDWTQVDNPPTENLSAIPLDDHMSVWRPEMAMSASDGIAEMRPYDALSGELNSFEAGTKKNAELFKRYAFSASRKFSTYMIGGYELSYSPEIDVFPKSGSMLVGINVIESPSLTTFATYTADEVALPDRLFSAVLNKSLSVIAVSDGDAEKYQISEREVVSLIQSAL